MKHKSAISVIEEYIKNTNESVSNFQNYFLSFDYIHNELDEIETKTALAICQDVNLNVLHNFIFALYKNKYDLSEFKLLNIFPLSPNESVENVINCYSKSFSGGIGDFLRGSIYLYESLQNKDVNFNIDFRTHPINEFITTNNNIGYAEKDVVSIEKKCNDNKERLPWSIRLNKSLCDTINNSKSNCFLNSFFCDALLVPDYTTNIKYYLNNYKPSKKCCNFFQQNIIFSQEVEDLYKSLNLNDYHVFHYRLGDMQTIGNLKRDIKKYSKATQENYNNRTFNHDYDLYYNQAKEYLKTNNCKNLIIMSDCNDFKSYIRANYTDPNIRVLHTKSVHTSYAPSVLSLTDFQNEDIERNKLLHTALDIMILSRSCRNLSFSVYDWGSGFVYWTSRVFDIPVSINTITYLDLSVWF